MKKAKKRFCRMYSRKEMAPHGYGPYKVTIVENFILKLNDGTKIASKVWFPGGLKHLFDGVQPKWVKVYCAAEIGHKNSEAVGEFPTILEFLPYNKGTYTAMRDHLRHPWLATHGYVVIRPDMRGTGDSTGFYFDEYTKQEQNDCCEIINWISQQAWSNGTVGMYGKSWGGFNGLQVSYCQPPALKAVITLYSTDNRYTDDIHSRGGCIPASGFLSWANCMFTWNAKPPHPEMFAGFEDSNDLKDDENIEKWKSAWRKRLEISSEPWTTNWLNHQTYDDYFKHGSICEDYGKITIPILAVGGWHDMYTNAVFRMCENIPSCRGLIGPWSHEWPDVAIPGPNIGFMNECLDFWDHHLKGKESKKQDASKKLTWYQCKGIIPPGPKVDSWPGQWCNTSSLDNISKLSFVIADNNELLPMEEENTSSNEFILSYDSNAGLTSGELLSFGAPDLPGEQNLFNNPKHTWAMPNTLDKPMDIFGFPKFQCEFSLHEDSEAMLALKMCDVFPNGSSRLITNGVLNLSHITSNENPKPLQKNTFYSCTILLDAIGYQVQPGHTICVSITPTYWPLIWPARSKTSITIRKGVLSIPHLEDVSKFEIGEDQPQSLFKKPLYGLPMNTTTLREPFYRRCFDYGLSHDTKFIKTVDDDGCKYNADIDTTFGQKNVYKYTLCGQKDPLSATAECKSDLELEFLVSDPTKRQNTKINTEQKMTCDSENFYLTEKINITLNNEDFFKKSYQSVVKRNFC